MFKQDLKKAIIFDFDGVIAQSLDAKTYGFSILYQPFGKNIINKVVKHHLENGGLSRFEKIKYYHKNFINKSLSDKEISDLANQFSDLVVEKVISAPLVPGVLDYIKQSFNKFKLFISTGTPTDEIKRILNKKGLDKYFTHVYGSPETKDIHIDKIIKKYKLHSSDLIFFGDSFTDLNAASKFSIDFILVKNKHNSKLSSNYDGKFIFDFTEL